MTHPEIQIQPYSSEHQSSVKTFLTSILEGEFGHFNVPRPDLEVIDTYYQIDDSNFWIALRDGEIVGTIGLKSFVNGIGYLQRMSVIEELRGSGLAQLLLATLENFAREKKYKTIYLATSENLKAANKFYPKEGFVRVESFPKEIPSPIAQIYFKKELV